MTTAKKTFNRLSTRYKALRSKMDSAMGIVSEAEYAKLRKKESTLAAEKSRAWNDLECEMISTAAARPSGR